MSELKQEDTTVEKPETRREETMDTQAETASNVSDTCASPFADWSDEELMTKAKEHYQKEQFLVAARMLKHTTHIADKDVPFQKEVEEKAKLLNHVIADLLADVEEHVGDDNGEPASAGQWIKGGEYHDDRRDTLMYYRLEEDLQLKCRLESPVESSLLVPLLAVLIETEQYMSWLPSWTVPRIGVELVDKLGQVGRTEQILRIATAVPWPFKSRDVVIRTCGVDDIDDIQEDPHTTGSIAISLVSLEEGQDVHKSTISNPVYDQDVVHVPPIPDGMERAEFDGGLLIRKCPPNHPCLRNSRVAYPPDEHLMLVGFSLSLDGKISPLFPTAVINFVIQTVITQMWAKLLQVAEEIRAGSRPQHAEVIAARREEIYDWVEQRIEGMFEHLASTTNDKEGTENGNDNTTDEKKEVE
ncbi:expressed unknown protein [Seminavis robusta]|uniref:Uncharacterized protein n=1 Tax=Seminavis robusta TaxID=568900 RepID=A0A9N8EX75_9STRA|nr:expressed unknown protein [Seminavis robusta]|eukprot:Sro2349_g324390.1 n/a (414) ;mRNA; r:13837-15078